MEPNIETQSSPTSNVKIKLQLQHDSDILKQKHFQKENILKHEEQQESIQQENQNLKQLSKQQIKIVQEIKKLGLKFNMCQINKDQFTSILSGAVSSFFTYLLTNISKRQQKHYHKFGWIPPKNLEIMLQKIQEQKRKDKQINVINEEKNNNIIVQQDQNKNLIKNPPKRIRRRIKKDSKKIRIRRQSNFDRSALTSKRLRNQFGRFLPNTAKTQTLNNSTSENQKSIQLKNDSIQIKKQPPIIRKVQQHNSLLKKMKQNYNCTFRNNRIHMQGMPKKPVSSFFFFFKAQSKNVQQECGIEGSKQLTYGSALAKKISQKWKSLSLQQKLPYKKMSEQTRQQYRRQMDQFKMNNSEVFEQFRKIKRMKANQYRKKRIQALNQNNSENSQSQNSESMQKIKEQQNDKSDKQQTISQKAQSKQNDSFYPSKISVKKRLSRARFKSEHKPKSPSPSFFFFYNEKKQEIKKKYEISAGAQISKYASLMWKQLSDDEKKPYQTMAEIRRKKYYEQMKKFQVEYPEQYASMLKYKQTPINQKEKQENQQDILSQQNSQISNSQSENDQNGSQLIQKQKINIQKKGGRKKNQQPSYKEQRPKAPLSSFFIFYRQNNAFLAEKFKQAHVSKLVQCASQLWKKMSDEQKKPYQLKSNQSRKIYYEQMQEYRQKYPQQIKQRKLDLKKKHQHQLIHGKKKRSRNKKPTESKIKVQDQIQIL